MYESFTDRARKVMQLANQESQRLSHGYIGTEHILLGLVFEGAGVAANVLKNLDVDLRQIRREVEQIVQPGTDMLFTGMLPQTPRAKKIIEYAIQEARALDQNYVGTEHLLLGLLREQEGVAAQILMNLGLTLEDVHQEILHLLGPSSSQPGPRRTPPELLKRRRVRKTVKDWPAEVRRDIDELDAQIAQLNQAKGAAVAEQDFEGAAYLRDHTDQLHRRKVVVLREWAANHPAEASWLSWNGGTVVRMARAISDEQSWHDLPVLADALEEAGCTDAEILSHCRSPQGHAGHCWVVDLLLGRL
jgi:ATP-dependent Clp protease ATP-binding subunit ClpA